MNPKIVTPIILIIMFSSLSIAQESNLISLGGKTIKVNPPKEMIRAEGKKAAFFEAFVPPSNRLLSAYFLETDLKVFERPIKHRSFRRYAMIQISRGSDNEKFDKAAFNELVSVAHNALQPAAMDAVNYTNKTLNDHLKKRGIEGINLKIGTPMQLGKAFEMENAYAYTTIAKVYRNSKSPVLIGFCCSLVRVKDRLLYFYIYNTIEDDTSLSWLINQSKNWTSEVLKLNQDSNSSH